MAWKLRKDKLKAGAPEAAEKTSPEPTPAPPSDETEQTPVFDLSGSAFQPENAVAPEEDPVVPSFLDDEPPVSLTGHASPTAEPEPIELEPLAAELPPAETVNEPSFLPDFDPVIALSPDIEPEAIAVAPVTLSPEAEPEPEEVEQHSVTTFDEPAQVESPADLRREAIAPGLVSMETETGLPKVAPFILDTPAAPAVETPRMHSVVIRIGKLSATHFLTKDVTTIGRPDSVTQNYPDIEIELDDGISRRHAEIRHTGSEYTLVDVGSTNGTILNGESLTPNEPVTLQTGDRIRVGERTELLFE